MIRGKLSKAIALMLVLVFLVMALPVSAAGSDSAESPLVPQIYGSEYEGSESSEEENDGTRDGEAYIIVYWSSWVVVAGYGFFSGTITYWNSSTGIAFGVIEPVANQASGTLDRAGYDRVTFVGWVRNNYNTEYFINFTV